MPTRKRPVAKASTPTPPAAKVAAKVAVKAPAKRPAAPPAKAPPKSPAPSVAAAVVARPAVAAQAPKPATASKPAKPPKAPKPPKLRTKPVRDSFTMPEADFALIATLKARALSAQRETKKSELLRAGLHALAALDTAALVAALGQLEPVKVGRPRKGH